MDSHYLTLKREAGEGGWGWLGVSSLCCVDVDLWIGIVMCDVRKATTEQSEAWVCTAGTVLIAKCGWVQC